MNLLPEENFIRGSISAGYPAGHSDGILSVTDLRRFLLATLPGFSLSVARH